MLEILHQDQDCIVFNKPSGTSLLRDRTGEPNFLDTIRQEFPECKLVHRLDKGTSGVLVVARSKEFQKYASRQFAKRNVRKFYVGVVCGHVSKGHTLTIDLPLKPGRKSRYRVAGLREEIRTHPSGWHIASANGYASETRLRVLEFGVRRSLLLLRPLSGRTHQLRVHLSWIGHAICGDSLYGTPSSREQSWPRLLLHSTQVRLSDQHVFQCGLPMEFKNALSA